jgi:hypothetical protein
MDGRTGNTLGDEDEKGGMGEEETRSERRNNN